MSMIGKFAALPPPRFAALYADAVALEDYLFPETGDYPNRVHPECSFLDVGKAWHGVHFLLTGTAWDTVPPLGLAVLGGQECGRDTGYGRPCYLEVHHVQEVSAALNAVSPEVAATRWSPEKFDAVEIYPFYWQEDPDRLEWLLESIRRLMVFYGEAAEQEKVVVKYLA